MTRLIYIADPMCSWCYGFGPELSTLLAQLGDSELILILGGLRAGNTQPMDDQLKATLRTHWQHVHEASGLKFSEAAMTQEGFIYDTEPACRAVVTVRESPPHRALDYFHAIQKAFYAQGRDVTKAEVLADIAAAQGLPREDFLAAWESAAMRDATRLDFSVTQRWGISGFPTLLVEHGGQLHAVTTGFARADDLAQRIREIAESPAEPATP